MSYASTCAVPERQACSLYAASIMAFSGMPEMVTEVDLRGLLGRVLLRAEEPYAGLLGGLQRCVCEGSDVKIKK